MRVSLSSIHRVNLLSVDEVTRIWRCHRITVLRLMRRGTLHPFEVDGELFFDEAEVLAIKSSNIAIFPHLVVAVGGSRPVTPEAHPIRGPMAGLLLVNSGGVAESDGDGGKR